ncbi:WD repeat-containing protein 92-like protein, partial [Diplonema papillatum]
RFREGGASMWEEEKPKPVYRQQIVEHVKKSVTQTIFDTKWVPLSNRVVACGNYAKNTGCLIVYQLNKGELEKVVEVEKNTPFKCMTFNHAPAETRTLATGNFQGELHVWDLERTDAAIYHTKQHTTIINGIDGACFAGPPEIVTGSRDGSVKVWDIRQKDRPVASLQPASVDKARDCWTVAFGNSFNAAERMVAAGYDNGDVKLFDMRTMKMNYEFNTANGICHLAFDRQDIEKNKLFVSSLEGRVRVYNLRTLHETLGYAYVEQRVGTGTIWQTKPLPQNREVFMSCGAGELALCRYQNPPQQFIKDADGKDKGVAGSIDEVNKAAISQQPVASFDWNKSKEGLAVCSCFDQTIRVIVCTKLNLL